jgi:hypothetical protein
VEAIIEGTWGGTGTPAEWADFILMRRMRWSWEQLQQTPAYVRRYCIDFLSMIGVHEERESERAERKARRQGMG